MSDPNQQEQDRWRELHELLGLPGDSAGAKPAPPPAPPKPAEPPRMQPAAYVAAEAPLPDEVEDVELPPPPLEAGMESDEGRTLLSPLDEELPPPLDEEETLPASAPPRGDNRGDDDRQQRGRRRGRRGGRARSPRDDVRGAAPMDTDDTEVEPTGQEAAAPAARSQEDDRRQPARGRRRPDDDLPDEPAFDDDETEASAQPAAPDDDDDEPVETFADWNVPSWPEIVASLYRPER